MSIKYLFLSRMPVISVISMGLQQERLSALIDKDKNTPEKQRGAKRSKEEKGSFDLLPDLLPQILANLIQSFFFSANVSMNNENYFAANLIQPYFSSANVSMNNEDYFFPVIVKKLFYLISNLQKEPQRTRVEKMMVNII